MRRPPPKYNPTGVSTHQSAEQTNDPLIADHRNFYGDPGPKVKANDKAYSSALKNLPDKPFDPWRAVC